MENKINIAEILKDCPEGIELYTLDAGNVTLQDVFCDRYYAIYTIAENGSSEIYDVYGRRNKNGECLVFPSKDCRTWENFKAPWKHKHFEAYDKVIVRTTDGWRAALYSHYNEDTKRHMIITGRTFKEDSILPYIGNDDKLGKEAKE